MKLLDYAYPLADEPTVRTVAIEPTWDETERYIIRQQETAVAAMKETIWLMDSDFCDNCGKLLGLDDCSGLCPTCFDLYIAETNEDDWYEGQDEDWADDAKDALPIFVVTEHPYFQEQLEQEKRERP